MLNQHSYIFHQLVWRNQEAPLVKRKRTPEKSCKESRQTTVSSRKVTEVSIEDSTSVLRISPRKHVKHVQGSNNAKASTISLLPGSASTTRTSPRRRHDSSINGDSCAVSIGKTTMTTSPRIEVQASNSTKVIPQSNAECDHADVAALRPQEVNGYFAESFLEKNVTAVRSCADCGIMFGTSYKASS